MVNSIPNANYSFPNISFNESVVGPTAFQTSWRNTIGIAGVFARGPVGPTRITNRSDFAYLYGENDTAGSLFIREAMLQGTSNFVLSRVLPTPQTSSGAIFLNAGNSSVGQDAFVSSGSNRTVGLTFSASYIGSPILAPGSVLGASVTTNATPLLLGGFYGSGYLDFVVREKVTPSSTTSVSVSASLVNNSSNSNIQVVTATGADGVALSTSAKPGSVLRTSASGVAFASGSSDTFLKILNYPYQVVSGTWAVLVQGHVTGATANATTTVSVEASSPSLSNYFVLSYAYRGADGAPLPGTIVSPLSYTTSSGVFSADGFFTVPVSLKSYQAVLLTQSISSVLSSIDTGIQLAVGDTGSSGTTELVPGARFSVPFVQGKVSVGETNTTANSFPNTTSAFQTGLSGADILEQLSQVINTDSHLTTMLSDLTLNNATLPSSLTFESTFQGNESNRVFYSLSNTYGGGSVPNDVLFQSVSNLYGTQIAMTGGQDGMQTAHLYLYDVNGNPLVYIEAVSPGSFGNQITISIKPSPPGSFRLVVSDPEGSNFNVPIQSESYVLSNYSVDSVTGLYGETQDSKIIRAYFVPVMNSDGSPIPVGTYDLTPQRIAPPVSALVSSPDVTNPLHPSHRGSAYLANLTLTSGSEPIDYKIATPSENDYLQAVERLEQSDCAIISIAGVSVSDARYELAITELINQAERSSTLNGLRIAVLAAPKGLTESRASSIASGVSSKRVVIVSGYTTLSGSRYLGTNSQSPVGFYCGVLAAISPHVSPAYASSAQITGVLSVDTKNTPSYLDTLTRARLEVLYYDPGLQIYKFLNGITTSNDPNERYISIRRLTDQIIMDLYKNLQWVRSAPNTSSLRSKVASGCDAYLKQIQRDEMILAFSSTLCDESNNSIQDIAAGKLNIRISFTPVYPADFIRVSLVRDLTTEFSISTGTAG